MRLFFVSTLFQETLNPNYYIFFNVFVSLVVMFMLLFFFFSMNAARGKLAVLMELKQGDSATCYPG